MKRINKLDRLLIDKAYRMVPNHYNTIPIEDLDTIIETDLEESRVGDGEGRRKREGS